MAYRGNISFGFGLTPWVKNLIIANVAVFIINAMVQGQANLYMAFIPARVLVAPWTLVTYMFAHADFWHLFWNMLILLFFGPPMEQRWGSNEFIKYYLICGLGGAALSFLFAYNHPIIGASAAVYGVMLAFALTWPEAPIYIWGILPVKAKYLVGVLFVISVLSMVKPDGSNIAHAAHLGGFVAGFLYLRLGSIGGSAGGLRKMMSRRRLKVMPGDDTARAARPARQAPGARRRTGDADEDRLLDELDRVLEKISTQGMSSLTPQERKLLDEVSRRYRTD